MSDDHRGRCFVPAPGTDAASAITGRAFEAPGFWRFAGALTGSVLFVPVLLLVWAAVGGSDGQRSAQVAWGVVLSVIGLGLVGRFAWTGTTIGDGGLTRVCMFRRVRISWEEIGGFSGFANRKPGLWAVPAAGARKPVLVPHTARRITTESAVALAGYLNWSFGLASVAEEALPSADDPRGPVEVRSRSGPNGPGSSPGSPWASARRSYSSSVRSKRCVGPCGSRPWRASTRGRSWR